MQLTALEPRFLRYLPGRVREFSDLLAEAQGVLFLCPLCFKANGNSPVGTHAIEVTFADRGVAAEDGSHGSDGQPTRWTVSGTGYADLSTQPSILLLSECAWHGFITNGVVT